MLWPNCLIVKWRLKYPQGAGKSMPSRLSAHRLFTLLEYLISDCANFRTIGLSDVQKTIGSPALLINRLILAFVCSRYATWPAAYAHPTRRWLHRLLCYNCKFAKKGCHKYFPRILRPRARILVKRLKRATENSPVWKAGFSPLFLSNDWKDPLHPSETNSFFPKNSPRIVSIFQRKCGSVVIS